MRTLEQWCLVLITCLPYQIGVSQNLVPNGGFEEFFEQPEYTAAGVNMSPHWLTLGTADFYHTTYSESSSIPQNFRGNQEPYEGMGYAGLIATQPREYIFIKLISPLERDEIYQVSFQINLSDRSQYASDDFGLSFQSSEPTQEDIRDYVYQVKNPENEFISDTLGWKLIEASYLARGGESYLLLGNLYAESRTNSIEVNPGGDPWSYYFIDDVRVEKCPQNEIKMDLLDTTICSGNSITLRGTADAQNYAWENQGIGRALTVSEAGIYVVNSFFKCSVDRQEFEVRQSECDCTLSLPGLHSNINRLYLRPSKDVVEIDWVLFDVHGHWLARTQEAWIDSVYIPFNSAPYFWRANLSCVGPDDRILTKSVSGKLIVQN